VTDQRKQNIIQAVRDYSRRLFYFIRGRVNTDEDAEDILQDVWYQFSNVMNSEPIEEASGWLYRVAKNRIIDNYRRKKMDPLDGMMPGETDIEFNLKEALLTEFPTPESEHLRHLFWEELFTALDELPEEQRRVFIWNEMEDKSFAAIAAQTGENVNTLISRKRYAVLHLRKRLAKIYKEITEQ